MIQKIINFIKGLFCKNCNIQGAITVVKISEDKQELIQKKKNLEKLNTVLKKKKNGK